MHCHRLYLGVYLVPSLTISHYLTYLYMFKYLPIIVLFHVSFHLLSGSSVWWIHFLCCFRLFVFLFSKYHYLVTVANQHEKQLENHLCNICDKSEDWINFFENNVTNFWSASMICQLLRDALQFETFFENIQHLYFVMPLFSYKGNIRNETLIETEPSS